ncbi:MAG: TATA-box-binding protein [Nitrososphaerales archaeon]
MPRSKPIISIVNVVATGDMGQTVDLQQIVKKFDGIQYEPERFPGLVFRLDKPKTSTLIFYSGRMVCTGSKSAAMATEAVRAVVKRLKKKGIKILKEPKVEVQNIVSSIDLGAKIVLKEVAMKMPRIMYEPEQFPAAILRVLDPKVVFLIFSSGKLVCTGGKKEEDVYKAVDNLQKTLETEGWFY